MTTKKRNEKYKLMARTKRDRLQAAVMSGDLRPREWRVCAHCGRAYPYYSNYLQHYEAQTCPKWLTGSDCGQKFRVSRMQKAAALGKGTPKKFKKGQGYCRKELCNKAPFCANIGSCLDLEIVTPGTMPLKADGSCKEPVAGTDSKHSRPHGIDYGRGAAHYV